MTTPLLACQLEDLENDQPRCFRLQDMDVLIVRHADQVYAVQNRCGHMSAALHRGEYTDNLIVCPLHGAGFRIETGEVEWTAIIPPPISEYIHSENARIRKFGELIEGAETRPIQTFPVEVKGNDVYVTVTG